MKSRRSWWLIFGLGSAAVIAALAWISFVVLHLEAEAQHEQWVRLALWRMDAWLGPRLRDEANRPYYEYLPFYPQERAYTKILNEIEPGEVYSPSPLLTFESDIFPLHFQVGAAGDVTSPQVPQGNWRDLAESGYLQPEFLARKQPYLDEVTMLVQPPRVEACVAEAESNLSKVMGIDLTTTAAALPTQVAVFEPPRQQSGQVVEQTLSQKAMSKADLQWRMNSKYQQQQEGNAPAPQQMASKDAEPAATIQIGDLIPLWMAPPHAPGPAPASTLLFVRRVRIGPQTLYQGMLSDWRKMRFELLAQVSDLFPNADLVPVEKPTMADVESGRMLGSVPVTLNSRCPMIAAGPMFTPARTTLGITWLSVLGAIIATGITLRASIAFGEKRSRFASAVTHELRTPLTTFRMYSEMLAEGMVRDEAQRKTYLETLKTESGRLATLVENVLSYARLEDGRAVSHSQRTTIGEMLQRLTGVLLRRASDAGMDLRVQNQAQDETPLVVDVEVVGQILFNLVDNACKYANGSSDRSIDLTSRVDDGELRFTVRDHGPGIAPEHAKRIFAPFDRGAHGPGDTIPGVGLGLSLARGLARDLGGDLTLENGSASDSGARFLLSIPIR